MSTRVIELARTFPTLAAAPVSRGADDFDALALDTWALTASSGGAHAARFVLGVWNAANGNPAARVQRRLTQRVRKVYDDCCLRGAEGDLADEAMRRFRRGEDALHWATQAAQADPRWAPLVDALRPPETHTTQEILAMLAEEVVWQCGTFDVMAALGTWDRAHVAAFLAWARSPWFA